MKNKKVENIITAILAAAVLITGRSTGEKLPRSAD